MSSSANPTGSYRHILRYTGLFGSVQALSVVLSVVRNKLTALFIGTMGMGLADLYMRTADLVGQGTNFGIAFSAVRRLAALAGTGHQRAAALYARVVRTWTLLAAALGAAVCVAASPLISMTAMGSASSWPAFALLAPVVAFTTLSGGEMAILKGLRRLRALATASVVSALLTLLITAPLYALWGLAGILPALNLSALGAYVAMRYAATRALPWRPAPLSGGFLRAGRGMLGLGLAYVGAGIMGAGAELAVRLSLLHSGGTQGTLGLYAAGFTLTVSYARLVFTAMDADYFARLSAAMSQRGTMNTTVNRQTDVLVLLIVPFLLAFALALPLLVRLLYTAQFADVIPMVICASGYMYFKALFSPSAYLPLAAGHSWTYMWMELTYDLFFATAVIAGYALGGLAGAGLGLTLGGAFNYLLVRLVYRRRYGLRTSRAVAGRALWMGLLLAAGLASAFAPWPALRWSVGVATLLTSALLALVFFRKA